MNQIVTTLLGLHGPAVYATITALVFLEAAAFIGLVVPGETALLVGGVLAARGNLSPALLLPLVALAAVAGDSVGYAIGRRFGPPIESSRAGQWIGADRWARVHDYVKHRGAWAVVLGRWVGIMRALVPAVAGMTQMPYRRFLAANVAGGLTWVALVTALGYLAGGAIPTAQAILGRLSLAGTAVLILLVALAVIETRRHRTRHATTPSTPPTAPAGTPGPALPTAPASQHSTAGAPPRSPRGRAASRWWLPAGVAAGATLAAVELLDAVRERADLAAYDPLVTADVVAERHPSLTVLAQIATFLGSTASIGALTLLLVAWTGWRRQWRTTGLIAAAMTASVALTIGLKQVVGRARPPTSLVLGPVDTGYAFPSGHTLNSTVFFGLLAALAVTRVHSVVGRAGIVLAWVGASAAVGLSRIYLGYHWLTDVMAGWSIALGVLAVTALAWTVLAGPPRATRHTTAAGA
jgi:undecaprenyl-diphosphatase